MAEVLVIGGGVVGLACAVTVARAGHDVVLVERHASLGTETSSRNSEVIHAGIYYPTDSLKTALCVEGRARLLHFCATHGVRHRLCGKLIVATTDEERGALDGIEARAAAAGPTVPLERWRPNRIKARAPGVRAVEALWSGGTGIVDAHGFMHQLRVQAEAADALILRGHGVVDVQPDGDRIAVDLAVSGVGVERHSFDHVVNAAGHAAPAVARMAGLRMPDQIAVKGNYFAISGPAPADTLVYPVPRANLVGLGTHLTIDLAGRGRLGPDVQLDADPSNLAVDGDRAAAFLASAQHFLPYLTRAHLTPDYAGFRPKLATDRFADFVIASAADQGLPRWHNLLGIESPGLTASLAIGARILELIARG